MILNVLTCLIIIGDITMVILMAVTLFKVISRLLNPANIMIDTHPANKDSYVRRYIKNLRNNVVKTISVLKNDAFIKETCNIEDVEKDVEKWIARRKKNLNKSIDTSYTLYIVADIKRDIVTVSDLICNRINKNLYSKDIPIRVQYSTEDPSDGYFFFSSLITKKIFFSGKNIGTYYIYRKLDDPKASNLYIFPYNRYSENKFYYPNLTKIHTDIVDGTVKRYTINKLNKSLGKFRYNYYQF